MFRPLGETVLVECITEEVRPGGIVVNAIDLNKRSKGVIVGLGRKVEDLCVGDKVLYEYGTSITLDNKSYAVVHQSEVLGVFD